MSEKAPRHEQQSDRHERGKDGQAEQREKLNELIEKAEHTLEKSQSEIENIAKEAKEVALSKEKAGKEIAKESENHHPAMIGKALKRQAYKKTLHQVQRKLPRRERAFSKVIHQDVVEKVSEVGSKTIARPSGLLGGGFFALLGTTLVVWMSRHYGFRYNYSVIIVLILAGFVAGLVLEALFRSGTKLLRRR